MNLLHGVELRILSSRVGVSRLAIRERWAEIQFLKDFEPSSKKIGEVLRKWPAPVEFFTERGLKMTVALGEHGPERYAAAKKLLHLLR
jgi:hypothetical protein